MKATDNPPFLTAQRRTIGSKLQQVMNLPDANDVENEFMELLKAADSANRNAPRSGEGANG
ncbi:MAG: hypothetical protein IPK75_17420 [Acidobacteria bacterium]|jgi:hypothetical protein|nr:hypothetical protein [Acidobacteriota bacterium]